MCLTVGVFRSGCGLYYQGRYRPIFTVIFNIGFSILLGYFFGITGIILATIASRFLTIWWYDAFIVYKYQFDKKPYSYMVDYILKILFVIALGAGLYFCCSMITIKNPWLQIVVNFVIAVIGFNGALIVCFYKNKDFQYVMEFVKRLLQGKKKERKDESD
jgi:hypothetical protein